MTCRDRLLLFTRYPEAGRSKTRLIPTLGAEGAAGVQRLLTEKIALQAKSLTERYRIKTVVYYCGGSKKKMASWLGTLTYVPQVQGDLGMRMRAAFSHVFAAGAGNAVLIGSDIPGIDTHLLADAFAALQNSAVVIGPSHDGGYYLIGLGADVADRLYPLLFEQIAWSTPEVFALTCERLMTAAIVPAVLATLRDIDTPEDLHFARSQGLM
jgi:uncharacterized protein